MTKKSTVKYDKTKSKPLTKEDWMSGIIGLILLSVVGIFLFKFFFLDKTYICGEDVSCENVGTVSKMYTNEPITGTVKAYFGDGTLKAKGYYENGKANGIVKQYFPSGRLHSETNWSKGQMNGTQKTYYENGQLEMEYYFSNGKRQGPQRGYHKNGKLMAEINFIDGKAEGYAPSYYENGQLKYECNFKNDKKNGSWKRYYENGQLLANGNFADDELDGVQKTYDENGQLKAEEYYRNGKKENYEETHAVGKKLNVISLDGKGVNSDLEIKLFLNNLKDAPLDVIDKIISDNSDYVQYNSDGQHTIIQFFDHQCKWSKKLSLEMREALKTKGKNIRWITVDVPIWGKDSEQVSLYVLAAKEQGKYRELFKAMNEINPSEKMTEKTVLTEAKKLGLDIDKLKNDANSYELKEKIQKNRSFFKSLELRGVPTLIIDGKIYLNGGLTKKQLDFIMNRLNK